MDAQPEKMIIQPQDYVVQPLDESKQIKIEQIKKICEEETAENRKKLARSKEIKSNLEGKLEAF